MDPSTELDKNAWEKGKLVGPGVKTEGTVMWRSCAAYYRKPGDKDWISMRVTGQVEANGTREVYVTGGEMRQMT